MSMWSCNCWPPLWGIHLRGDEFLAFALADAFRLIHNVQVGSSQVQVK